MVPRGILTPVLSALALLVTAAAAGPDLRTYGTVDALIRNHDAAPKVVLTEVLSRPHAYGLGSLSDLRGEITILDGTAWMSFPPERPGDDRRVEVSRDGAAEAGFLVAAYVDSAQWKPVKIAGPLASETFDGAFQQLAAQNGLGDAPFPFLIEGQFPTLTLAIADGRRLASGPGSEAALQAANYLEQEVGAGGGVEGTLVGFYTPTADARFTHPGARTHVHAVIPARRATGHAAAFTVAPGATLWLPIGTPAGAQGSTGD